MRITRIIYCPECQREVYEQHPKRTINFIARCKCGRFLLINPERMTVRVTDKPIRESSSGVRSY